MSKDITKVTLTLNKRKDQIKVEHTPVLRVDDKVAHQNALNTLLYGFDMALRQLLSRNAMMRPASQDERDAKIYVFTDPVADNAMYKVRRELHDAYAKYFNDLMEANFPDVRFIEGTREFQQDLVMNLTPEEAVDHQRSIAELTAKIRNHVATEPFGDDDGDEPEREPFETADPIDNDGGFDPAGGE